MLEYKTISYRNSTSDSFEFLNNLQVDAIYMLFPDFLRILKILTPRSTFRILVHNPIRNPNFPVP